MPKIQTSQGGARVYWIGALSDVKNLRKLTFAAIMLAVQIVISSLFIPVGENLRIYFSFTATTLACLVGGPVTALVYGVAADLLGFMIHPSGAFFPGYTLSSMAGAVIYALYFYRARISVLRIFLAKLSVNAFVNVGMGSLWSAILFGKGYYYYLAKSAVKNTLMLPLEVLIIFVLLRLLLPILARNDIIPKEQAGKIRWI